MPEKSNFFSDRKPVLRNFIKVLVIADILYIEQNNNFIKFVMGFWV
jgi:hypothetical protein